MYSNRHLIQIHHIFVATETETDRFVTHKKNIYFNPTKLKILTQECIPVGCIPSAAVAVSTATHTPPRATHAPLSYACPPVDRQTPMKT